MPPFSLPNLAGCSATGNVWTVLRVVGSPCPLPGSNAEKFMQGKPKTCNAGLLCVQVITVADFHPQQSHTFAFATSKGAIRVADLRASALADNSCKAFEEVRSATRSNDCQ